MRPTTLLVLLLVVAAATGAAWLLLQESPAEIEVLEDDPFPEAEPAPAAGGPRTEPPTRPAVVEAPAPSAEPRVAVLAEGARLPGHGTVDRAALDALHETFVEGDPVALSGAELLEVVGRVTLVRLRSEADLKALQRLGPDPDWPQDDPLPITEVLEHWRREGFEVETRGPYLVVTRRAD